MKPWNKFDIFSSLYKKLHNESDDSYGRVRGNFSPKVDFFIVSIWQVEAFQYDYIFRIQNSKPWYINHSFQLRTSISKYLCQFSGSTCSLSSTRISCYCCHLLDSLKFFVVIIEGHNLDNPYLNLNLQPKYITVVTKGWSKPSTPGNEFN